jgi:hypothetical protein
MFEYCENQNFPNKSPLLNYWCERGEYHHLKAESYMISLSILIFIAAMILEGLLLLPIIGSSLKAQVETFTAYIFATSIVMLAVAGITSLFKRKL